MKNNKEARCYFNSLFFTKTKSVFLKIIVVYSDTIIYKNKIRFHRRDGGIAKDSAINKVFRLLNKLELDNSLSSYEKVTIFINDNAMINQVLDNGLESVRKNRKARVQLLSNVLKSHKNWELRYNEDTNNILKRLWNKKDKKVETVKHNIVRKISGIKDDKIQNIIFFDMEMNCNSKKNSGSWEAISIGAVKYNIQEDTIDQFYSLIKPQHNRILSDKCIELTNISQKEINNADNFRKVMYDFERWVNYERSIFVSWGAEDIRTIKSDNKTNGFRLQIVNYMRNNYIDFQKEFCFYYLNSRQAISLTNKWSEDYGT